MPACMIITDAPETVLDAGEKKVSRVQIAKTGKFSDPRYGKFAITQADFSTWIKNFNTLHKKDGRLGLPIDVDHAPEKKGETEAAGWITDLEVKGNELWAVVEWNSLGVELVSDRRYAYLSPSYQHNFKDEEGKSHGTALVGVALTNRPFLTMATVSLSAQPVLAVEDPGPLFASMWDNGALPNVPYMFASGGTTYTVTATTTSGTGTTSDSPDQMPDLKNIATKLGLPEGADEATILAKLEEQSPASVDLDALAKADGKVLMDEKSVRTLAADAAAGREALKELTAQKFERAFDKALDAGKVVPAERDTYLKLYDADAETTLAALEARPVVLSTELQGSSGGADSGVSSSLRKEAEGFDIDEGRADLHERAVKLAAERNIDYADAVFLAAEAGV